MLLSEKNFIKLAEEGKIKVKLPLRTFRIDWFGIKYYSRNTKMATCNIEKYWASGFSYKINLVSQKNNFENRDMYTSTIISLINEGIAQAIITL